MGEGDEISEASLRSASSSTFFRKRASSVVIHFFRSARAFASRAKLSRSLLQTSAMSRMLCLTSGILVGSFDGDQEFSDTSANDDTSRG